jgi:hypothetical protein
MENFSHTSIPPSVAMWFLRFIKETQIDPASQAMKFALIHKQINQKCLAEMFGMHDCLE